VLVNPLNAPDQKRARNLDQEPALAPVFCIWMLDSHLHPALDDGKAKAHDQKGVGFV
jgi:hypothetical protein